MPCSSAEPFFVYGHWAARNDEHVYNALFTSKVEHPAGSGRKSVGGVIAAPVANPGAKLMKPWR
jgi:hypothetical protein